MAVETTIETYRGVVYPWQMDHMNVPFPDDIAKRQAGFIDARARPT